MAMRAVLVLAAGWFVANTAFADIYRVGNTDLDYCDYASIQDAIDAATASGPGLETILIANTGTYTNVSLVVGDKSLVIEGGFDTCQFANPDVPADLSGDGSSAVITIEPVSSSTQVTLHGLTIHGGGVASVFGPPGGGVAVTGNAHVTIEDTTIQNNNARIGGGICIQSNAPYPTVQLNPGVRIIGNHAEQDGGGVYLTGGTLGIAADRVNIDNNSAGQRGGGILSYQGLIYIGNPAQGSARHDVTGASVSGNSAQLEGGGIFLSTAGSQLFAYELILDSNTAGQSGGGIALSQGAYAFMARDYPNAYEFQCPNASQCSRISNNSVGSGAAGTHGGALALSSGSHADIAQTIVRGNTAQDGSAVYVDDGTILNLESVLVTGNQSNDSSGGGKTIRTNFSATAPQVRIAYATFAGNYDMSNGTNYLAQDIQAKGGTQLSIFSSAFYDNLDVGASSSFTDDCVVGSFNNSTSAYGTYTRKLVTSTPGFVDAAAGDYRLQGSSALNDYCDSSAYVAGYRDIQLTPRCQDDPGKTNTYGSCDVGAYEYSDRIFGNGFE
jgi:hypothetical protein